MLKLLKNAKQCPFCGESVELSVEPVFDEEGDTGKVSVSCGRCGARGPRFGVERASWATGPETAVALWDGRK